MSQVIAQLRQISLEDPIPAFLYNIKIASTPPKPQKTWEDLNIIIGKDGVKIQGGNFTQQFS